VEASVVSLETSEPPFLLRHMFLIWSLGLLRLKI